MCVWDIKKYKILYLGCGIIGNFPKNISMTLTFDIVFSIKKRIYLHTGYGCLKFLGCPQTMVWWLPEGKEGEGDRRR